MSKKVKPHYDDAVSYEKPRRPKNREEGRSRGREGLNDGEGSIGIPMRRRRSHRSSQASVSSLRVILNPEAPRGAPYVGNYKEKDGYEDKRERDRKRMERKYKSQGEQMEQGRHRRAKREDVQETLPVIKSFVISTMYRLVKSFLAIMAVWLILITCAYASMRSNPEGTSPSATLLPPHPLAEQYPSKCPPNFRYYPNYERVLGMPAPLYSDLHPPFHVVHRYHRAAMKCWHDDKRRRYPFLSDAQWEEIGSLIKDSYTKLMYNSDTGPIWPRFVKENENSWLRASGVVLEKSRFWRKKIKPLHLSLYDRMCTCTLTLALFPERWSFTPASNASFEEYCPCTVAAALQVYVWFWKNNLPPMGNLHDWYELSSELSPGTSIFDAVLYAMSKVALNLWTSEDKVQLHKHGWISMEELRLESRMDDEVLQAYMSEKDKEEGRCLDLTCLFPNLFDL